MKKDEAILILPTQLFEQHPLLAQKSFVFLLESPRYFSDFDFHVQKRILHRATMQMYYDFLQKKGHNVIYVAHDQAAQLGELCQKKGITTLHCCDPTDLPHEKTLTKMLKKHGITMAYYETPQFITPTEWIEDYFADAKHMRQQGFYIAQRKRLNILLTKKGTPIGGKWSFDKDNRKPLPEDVAIPPLYRPRETDAIKKARAYVQKTFKQSYGQDTPFIYPTTFATAKKWLDDFLAHRFASFGTYQDAMVHDEPFLFHSLLSPLLNIGLLTPAYVLEATLNWAQKHKTPINSLEGFIRQLIGWREYVRAVYLLEGETQRKENFFKHTRTLSASFWQGTTGIEPIDDTVNQVLTHAYAHHILRLMVLGNFMLLCEIQPDDVYRWFMELFIDAYDWVMVPNVYGMSQYADGGLMTTKPYISSSNYILKMSDFKKGSWCPIWDALYWHFIYQKRAVIKKTARLAIMQSYLKRMKPSTLKAHLATAKTFLSSLA